MKLKKIIAWGLSVCMITCLLPVTALAAAPNTPSGLRIEVGGNYYQTLPVLTWNKVSGASNYNISAVDNFDQTRLSGGTSTTRFSLDSVADITIKKCLVTSELNGEESDPAELACNVEISYDLSSTTKTAINNSVEFGGDTYQLYTFNGLPENTTVRLEYGSINENDNYIPKMSNPFETNSDGTLVIYEKVEEHNSHYPNGAFDLGDGEIGADDRYYLTTYTDTEVDGEDVSFTEIQYPVAFDFNPTTTDTQAVEFDDSSTQSLTRGETLTNTASSNRDDGGSILYFTNSGNCVVDPDTGKVTPIEPIHADDDFAYVYAFASAVEGKYPAAISRYGINITWTDQEESQDLTWSDGGGDLNTTYGESVIGHTAVNDSGGGGDITYTSSDTDVATVNSTSGEVTIKGVGTVDITATAAAVEGQYRSTSVSYTINVAKKDITVSAENNSKKFGEDNPIFTFTVDDSSALVTGDNDDDLAVTLTTTATKNSNVGNYLITGTSTSSKYNVMVNNGTLTVSKAGEPTVDNITKSLLNSEAHTDVTVDITGLPSNITNISVGAATGNTEIINGSVTTTSTGIKFSTNIGADGQRVIIPVTVSMQNYEDTTVNVEVSLVNKAPVTITGVTVADKAYDGSAVSYTGTPSNEQGYTGEYDYVWSSGSAPKDAGSYTLTVKVPDGNADYMGQIVIPFTIDKKALTVKPQNLSIYRGASLPTSFSLEYVGKVSGDTITPTGTPEFALKDGGDILTNSNTNGTYTIEWTNKDEVAIDNANYDITKANGTLSISTHHSSGGGSSSSSTTTVKPDVSTSKDVSTATVEVKAKNDNGTAKASVTSSSMNAAVKAAEKAANENDTAATVEIQADTPSGTDEIEFSVSKTALDYFADSDAEKLSFTSKLGGISMDTKTAASIVGQAESSDVGMNISSVDTQQLNEEQRAAVGDAPVYDISITTGDDKITSFDGNSITITLPYELKESEDPSNVVVWYLDAQGNIQNVEATYDEATGTVVFTTKHLSLYAVGYDTSADTNANTEVWNNPYTDVSENSWYYDAVLYANQHGLMSGTTPTEFSPEMSTTRSMLINILYRLEGSPAASKVSFSDVDNTAWYANAVNWAVENGIVTGYGDGQFGPNDSVTREQMAVILMNYAKLKNYDTNVNDNRLSTFTDVSSVSYWASEAMEWAVTEELISGKTELSLDPDGSATRSQTASILMRFAELYEK